MAFQRGPDEVRVTQEPLVKESLFQFIAKNIPSANLDEIDDIVLTYVISILEEASEDPTFDVEGFIEIMTAYVPEFADVGPVLVCEWLLELEEQLRPDETDSTNQDDMSGSDRIISLTMQSLRGELAPKTPPRSHSNSESSSTEPPSPEPPSPEDTNFKQLQDTFPYTSPMEIKHCLHIGNGVLSEAVELLLVRQRMGEAMTGLTLGGAKQPPACNDNELKNRIIERYSYVDENSLQREHKPLAPKNEPKKMVRYRDNKIVSLKGERYTEVPKSGCEEEKLKKPKKQHSP